METDKKQKFHWRSFISFFNTAIFLIISISGIFLYFAPPGRVAFWSEWRFIGFSKEQWQAIHTIFSFLFVIIAGFHIYFNWPVLKAYLKKRIRAEKQRKKELKWALVFTLVIFILTGMSAPPFGTIMDFGEELSNSWANEETEPPIPHAERMKLNELVELLGIDMQKVTARLEKEGIVPDSLTIVVKDLAHQYNLTPSELFEKMKIEPVKKSGSEKTLSATSFGFGYGRMVVKDVCEKNDIDIELAIQRLKQKGIAAESDDNLKTLASEHKMLPIDIFKIITGEE